LKCHSPIPGPFAAVLESKSTVRPTTGSARGRRCRSRSLFPASCPYLVTNGCVAVGGSYLRVGRSLLAPRGPLFLAVRNAAVWFAFAVVGFACSTGGFAVTAGGVEVTAGGPPSRLAGPHRTRPSEPAKRKTLRMRSEGPVLCASILRAAPPPRRPAARLIRLPRQRE
jgi:hypothetical protein